MAVGQTDTLPVKLLPEPLRLTVKWEKKLTGGRRGVRGSTSRRDETMPTPPRDSWWNDGGTYENGRHEAGLVKQGGGPPGRSDDPD